MKIYKWIIIIIYVTFNLNIYSINIESEEFYSIKMNLTYEQVVQILKKMGKVINIEKDKPIKNYIVITPKNQIYSDITSRDFQISFYENKILSFDKYNVKKDFIDFLIKKYGKYKIKDDTIPDIIFYNWKFNSYVINLKYEQEENKEIITFSISNIVLLANYQKKYNEIFKQ